MEKKRQSIEKGIIKNLYTRLVMMSSCKKMPLKRCISLNLEILEKAKKDIEKEYLTLLEKMIIIDENGEYVMKEGYVSPKGAKGAEIEAFQLTEGYSAVSAKKELEKFEEEKVELELYSEDINRQIRISCEKGFERVPLIDVLEDPNNDLSPGDLVILNKFILFDSLTDNI